MSEGVYDVAIIERAGEAKALSRDNVLKLEEADVGKAPIATVYGGKIATYRRRAERVTSMLAPTFFDAGGTWTAGGALPGGDFPVDSFEGVVGKLRSVCPACDDPRARPVRAHGPRARKIFAGVTTQNDWGRDFGADPTQHEVLNIMDHERAIRAVDVLWRRSRLGLFMTGAADALGEWMRAQPRAAAASAA